MKLLCLSKLTELDNLIITPHVVCAPLTTRKRLLGIVYSNIEAFLRGESKNKVN